MTNQEAYNIWAPPQGRWSAWVKPVLFAQWEREWSLEESPTPTVPPTEEFRDDWRAMDVSWAPEPSHLTVLVVDLPGEESARTGLALAARGYRPVPLYNSCDGPFPVVDVKPTLHWLRKGTLDLQQMNLSPDAPPAFLLDSNRRTGRGQPGPGDFDNRSISFPTDFPSANLLRGHGVERALLAQRSSVQPQPDLAHTLRRWQEVGIKTWCKRIELTDAPMPVVVERPSLFGWAWYRALEWIGMRRGELGGYGGYLPEASSS